MNYGRILIPTRERIKRFKVCGNSSLLLFIVYELCACITLVYVLELTARRIGISLIRKISLQLAKQWSPQTGIFSLKDKRFIFAWKSRNAIARTRVYSSVLHKYRATSTRLLIYMKQERDGCLALIAPSHSTSRLKDHSSWRERLIKLIDQNLASHTHIYMHTYIYISVVLIARS